MRRAVADNFRHMDISYLFNEEDHVKMRNEYINRLRRRLPRIRHFSLKAANGELMKLRKGYDRELRSYEKLIRKRDRECRKKFTNPNFADYPRRTLPEVVFEIDALVKLIELREEMDSKSEKKQEKNSNAFMKFMDSCHTDALERMIKKLGSLD